MEKEIQILKDLFIPVLQKDERFEESKCDSFFWNKLTDEFINFEHDKKPFYASIYSLNLENVEQVLNKLESLLNPFLDQLAESYVQGNSSDITQKLSKVSHYFNDRVLFYNDLKKAIFLSERKRLKSELPSMFEKYSFEIDGKKLIQAITNSERQDLKNKFKQWDKELEYCNTTITDIKFSLSGATKDTDQNKTIFEEEGQLTYSTKSNRKIISLSLIKYTVAACIVLTAGIMYLKFNTDKNFIQPNETNVVTAPVKKDINSRGTNISEIPSEALAEVATVTKTTTVIESGFGFASKEKKIKIIENNQRARMQSILIAIDRYRKFLEKEFTENKVGDGPVIKEIDSKIKALQNELALLKERENHYVFDGKELVIHNSNTAKENSIVLYDKKYYLKQSSDYFLLRITNKPENFIKVSNTDVIDNLNEIIFGDK